MLPTSHEGTEVVTEVAFQYRVTEEKRLSTNPLARRKDQWHFQADAPHTMERAIFACGGKRSAKAVQPSPMRASRRVNRSA
jgi:hypothetical protein